MSEKLKQLRDEFNAVDREVEELQRLLAAHYLPLERHLHQVERALKASVSTWMRYQPVIEIEGYDTLVFRGVEPLLGLGGEVPSVSYKVTLGTPVEEEVKFLRSRYYEFWLSWAERYLSHLEKYELP